MLDETLASLKVEGDVNFRGNQSAPARLGYVPRLAHSIRPATASSSNK